MKRKPEPNGDGRASPRTKAGSTPRPRDVASPSIRRLVVLFGDQLDRAGPWREGFDPRVDAIWMAEAAPEATRVWSHQQRIVLFLSAMRHFRDDLQQEGLRVHYRELTTGSQEVGLGDCLRQFLEEEAVGSGLIIRPGEYRILAEVERVFREAGIGFQMLEDSHFYSTPADFADHAKARKALRMEYFYREMRKRFGVLLEDDGKPTGGDWNFDSSNRQSFGSAGPGEVAPPRRFKPDQITKAVISLVESRFADHPGETDTFGWPVTPEQAEEALDDFLNNRLAAFGDFQDAVWAGEPFLYHSLIAAALNLKLLNPRRVVERAELAYRQGRAPLPAVEGFIRQILGWREYVRGIYWRFMPEYLDLNAMGAEAALPDFYWTGETEMACLRDVIKQTLRYGYAHHIQRLMVTGLYALLLGVKPQRVHEWYLAVYVDAVEWVELPNTLGMSQYGDGGLMASKPYVATGKYLQRMTNYCKGCRFDPGEAVGERACPFTTLYWDYLQRHRKILQRNPRMGLQLKNLDRLTPERKRAIREQARQCPQ